MIIRVDIDETICEKVDNARYQDATPIPENIAKINQLYNDGHTIIYWTSRGMTTGLDWSAVTQRQLVEWGCKFNKLEMGKPFYDMLICDKSKRIEEI